MIRTLTRMLLLPVAFIAFLVMVFTWLRRPFLSSRRRAYVDELMSEALGLIHGIFFE